MIPTCVCIPLRRPPSPRPAACRRIRQPVGTPIQRNAGHGTPKLATQREGAILRRPVLCSPDGLSMKPEARLDRSESRSRVRFLPPAGSLIAFTYPWPGHPAVDRGLTQDLTPHPTITTPTPRDPTAPRSSTPTH